MPSSRFPSPDPPEPHARVFLGTVHQFKVRGCIVALTTDSEIIVWPASEDETPDLWTVYRSPLTYPWDPSLAVFDHREREVAEATARMLADEDKAWALLQGRPTD